MKIVKFFSALLLLLLTSCSKEKTSSPEECKDCITAEGVVYYGDPAVDGCGWGITIENQHYSLNKFKEEDFKISGKVKIVYKKTEEIFYCGRSRVEFKIIEIVKIEEL